VRDVEFLELEDLLRLVRSLALGPVRDVGLLDSACARPQSRVFGRDAYPSLALKAAAMLHSLARNHALIDGNKRLAWLAAVVFLDLNGYESTLSDDQAFDLVMDVARGNSDIEEIASRLQAAPTREA
jgi:death on curing protein